MKYPTKSNPKIIDEKRAKLITQAILIWTSLDPKPEIEYESGSVQSVATVVYENAQDEVFKIIHLWSDTQLEDFIADNQRTMGSTKEFYHIEFT